jgi:hypothetical protein
MMGYRRKYNKQAGVQYEILVTNGVLLSESSYLQLLDIGSDTVQGLP